MLLLISGLSEGTRRQEFEQIYEQNYRTMYYVALKILKNKEEAEVSAKFFCKTCRTI